MRKFKIGSSKGFTLVELLVVIAIIGVLSTLLLLQLNIARAKARDAKRVADINQMRSAVELYYDDQGEYPDSNNFSGGGTNPIDLTMYLNKIPVDPVRPNCDDMIYDGGGDMRYGYAYAGTTMFHLYAELETGSASALKNDLDADTATDWATCPTGAGTCGGVYQDGVAETCTSSATIDCVYDTGQTQ